MFPACTTGSVVGVHPASQARKTCPGCKAVTARHGLLVKSQARFARAVVSTVEPVYVYARP